MEIVKHSEIFNLTETTELFEISGNVSCEVSGGMNIHFTVSKLGGEHLGNCHYNKTKDSADVNFGVNCPEEVREDLTVCADAIISSVLEKLEANN